MIVVADASPLNYLALLGKIDVLPALFTKVLVPPAVHRELSRPKTPPAVLAWASALPVWCEVRPLSSAPLVTLAKLDDGERDAIQLAIETGTGILLMDEREGRREVACHHLKAIGTLSILEAAAAKGPARLSQCSRESGGDQLPSFVEAPQAIRSAKSLTATSRINPPHVTLYSDTSQVPQR